MRRAPARIAAVLVATAFLASSALPARAETTLTERLRVQGVYAHLVHQAPADDVAAQAFPELSLVSVGKRASVRVTYTFVGSLHSATASDVANRVGLASTFELSKRTTMLASADAGHSTATTALLTAPPSAAPTGAVPLTLGQLVSGHVAEATTTELSPVVRFDQTVSAAYVRSVDHPISEGWLTDAVLTLDRVWQKDALGVDARASFARSRREPIRAASQLPAGGTLHWRHDLSRTLSSYVAGGAAVVLSPDRDTRHVVRPLAQGQLAYQSEEATVTLAGTLGPQPNPLTAELLYSGQATLRATVPISVRHGVLASATAGWTRGTLIELRRSIPAPPSFDTLVADAGIGWAPTPYVELFARYQFLDQITAAAAAITTPEVLRHAAILGIQLSSRPDPARIPTTLPQRVDRADAAPSEPAPTTLPAPDPASETEDAVELQ